MRTIACFILLSLSAFSAETITQEVEHGGTSYPVYALPDEGYHFLQWSDGKTDNPRVDSGVTGDIDVTALFEINQYLISFITDGTEGAMISMLENGVISIASEQKQTVIWDQSTTPVKALAPEGFHFKNWTVEYQEYGTSDELVLNNVKSNMVLVANFARNSYTLKYSAGENGYLEGEEEQQVGFNEDASPIKAVANKGYKFDRWSDNLIQQTRQDLKIKQDLFVMAYFRLDASKAKFWGKYQ